MPPSACNDEHGPRWGESRHRRQRRAVNITGEPDTSSAPIRQLTTLAVSHSASSDANRDFGNVCSQELRGYIHSRRHFTDFTRMFQRPAQRRPRGRPSVERTDLRTAISDLLPPSCCGQRSEFDVDSTPVPPTRGAAARAERGPVRSVPYGPGPAKNGAVSER